MWLLASGAWIMSWVIWLMIYRASAALRDIHEVFAIPVLLFGPPVCLFWLVAGWGLPRLHARRGGGGASRRDTPQTLFRHGRLYAASRF